MNILQQIRKAEKLLFTAATISLAVIYLIQWAISISESKKNEVEDFISFYAVGKIVQEKSTQHIYDIHLQKQAQERTLGIKLAPEQVLLYIHPPQPAYLLALIITEDYPRSLLVWVSVLIIFYIIALFQMEDTSITNFWAKGIISMLVFYPLFVSLYQGQDTAIFVLGIALWYRGVKEQNKWLIFTGLALTTVRPHLFLVFSIGYFLAYRKISWEYLLAGALMVIGTLLMLGWDGTLDLIQILVISMKGTWFGLSEHAMVNLPGFFLRAFPGIPSEFIEGKNWMIYMASIVAAFLIWTRNGKTELWKISLTVTVSLLFSPHLHYHDLTALLIPLLFLARELKPLKPRLFWGWVILSYSLLTVFIPAWYYYLPYILYGVIFYSFWNIQPRHNEVPIPAR